MGALGLVYGNKESWRGVPRKCLGTTDLGLFKRHFVFKCTKLFFAISNIQTLSIKFRG
jgi:hypothetical protein